MKKKITVIAAGLLLVALCAALVGCYASVRVPDSHYAEADRTLVNPDADACAVELMRYLGSVYGEKVISGQYVNEYEDYHSEQFRADPNDPDSPSTVFRLNELQAVHGVTGEYPALLGLDVSGIECGEPCYTVEQAIEWHNAGGIVTLCWHWKVDNFDGKPRAFYSEQTDFSLAKALRDKDSAQYKGLIADIDAVSEALQPLREAGVPVLWRPLHEASGGWFWWGASGRDAYVELWNIVFERMTEVHELNNLIWVYNGQNTAWYVGDDKCDIIGDDPYYDFNLREEYEKNPSNAARFKMNYKTSGNKMIMMSENDFVFDIDAAFEENTRWLTFCTWCREFVCVYEPDESGEYRTYPVYSAMCSSADELRAAYTHERTVTLSSLVASGEYNPAG